MLQVDKIFIIHTKTGLDYRRKHIEEEMSKHNIDFEFMLDGDISDLNEEILEQYFSGWMKARTARTSCALKHILVLEKIVNTPLKNALIFEDDVILHKDFSKFFNQIQKEINDRKDISEQRIYIDFDNSTLEFISDTNLEKNTLLYKKDKTRGGGGYFITFEVAKLILRFIKKNKCYTSNDLLFNEIFKKYSIPVFWSHPPLVEQASNNGMWESSLGNQPQGFWRKIRFNLHKFINQNIYYKWFKK